MKVLGALHDCARFLREGWSGPWLEQYKYEDSLYASFGEETGQLHCFKRGSLLYADTIPCNHGKPIANEISTVVTLDNLSIYLINCINIFNVLFLKLSKKMLSKNKLSILVNK